MSTWFGFAPRARKRAMTAHVARWPLRARSDGARAWRRKRRLARGARVRCNQPEHNTSRYVSPDFAARRYDDLAEGRALVLPRLERPARYEEVNVVERRAA